MRTLLLHKSNLSAGKQSEKKRFKVIKKNPNKYVHVIDKAVSVVRVLSVPVFHALVHLAMLDTLFLHVGAASSQTLHRLLELLFLQGQQLHFTPVHTHQAT